MKFKNYKSALHNFAHSFMAIDYTRSGKLSINVLIDLFNSSLDPKARFDFLNNVITPEQSRNESSAKLIEDYSNWLPNHCVSHKCDFSKLELLVIEIWVDTNSLKTPKDMNDTIEFDYYSKTTWKALNHDVETIEISNLELINKEYLKIGVPEL